MQTAQSLTLISGLPRLESRMLLEFVLGKPREWLLAHDTDALAPEATAHFLSLASQRRQGIPMAYLVGHREFMGHRLSVSDQVLIPRPETELLVEMALQSLTTRARCSELGVGSGSLPEQSCLDLGTGSGAVAISVSLAAPAVRVVATDLSDSALAIAQSNACQLGASVQFWQGSWYEALPSEGRFDVIVSNPPYIAHDDSHLLQGDVRFEPLGALTDGADGLTSLRRIIVGASQYLKAGGWLWLEHGYQQGAEVARLLFDAGFKSIQTKQDLAGLPRVSGGSL